MDRRIKKTQSAIFEAFIGLLAEKNFEQITINEIADRANVNRGTVYLHYADKYQLLDQIIETHLNQLVENCLSIETGTNFSSKESILRTLEYLEQHVFFYSTLLTNKGVPAFRNRLLTLTVDSMSKQIDLFSIHDEIDKQVLVQFLASGAVGILEWWIIHSIPYPAAVMVDRVWLLLEQIQLFQQPVNPAD